MAGDLHDDITQIEARIEALAGQIERCRKISIAAKLAIAAGAAWIVLTLLGPIPFSPGPVVAALASAIGGTVLLGSNATTWTQTQEALRASESLRAEMIGRMELRVVGEESRTLH
ncbi:MAG: hypothetical protein WA792_06290 [Pseudolabrys sp.]